MIGIIIEKCFETLRREILEFQAMIDIIEYVRVSKVATDGAADGQVSRYYVDVN